MEMESLKLTSSVKRLEQQKWKRKIPIQIFGFSLKTEDAHYQKGPVPIQKSSVQGKSLPGQGHNERCLRVTTPEYSIEGTLLR